MDATRGPQELQYRDQHIPKESKMKHKILAMAWIDYRKVYDMVLQSWIKDCLKLYIIYNEIIKFIEETVKNWKGEW